MSNEAQQPAQEQPPQNDVAGKTYTEEEVNQLISGLKTKNSELLTETKAEREKRQQLEQAQEEARLKAAEQSGQYKEISESLQKQLEKTKQDYSSVLQQMQDKDINLAVGSVASSLAQDERRQALLAKEVKELTKYKDGVAVFEVDGLEVSKDQLVEHVRSKYDFLCDASVGSGGGATGSNSGAGAKTMKRSDFTKLPPGEQSSFVRSGGKVI